jgi:hypothetical protein
MARNGWLDDLRGKLQALWDAVERQVRPAAQPVPVPVPVRRRAGPPR